ncbi:Putative increased recombination centers protein 11 [Cytospora mali]|uniref:Increased recombination centers protein 11 n=1 Tax=Cytospora mali TaxID=578113 RepID=A0A194VF65_CYTMA|nr:Putative increased recombination centers protein 11 [Valsa mali var. pyri (nom. inval.)]
MEATNLDGPHVSVPAPSKSSTLRALTPTTISTSHDYQHRLAEVSSRATLHDPLNRLFQREKTGPSTPITSTQLYDACLARIETKTAAGAFVVEAAGFAAVACWEPPQSIPPDLSEEELQEIARQGRPVFAAFLRDLQYAKQEVLGDHKRFWSLSLMARDPNRKDKGAVRAVIEPFVARARREGVPLWLVAGNQRARNVYSYFGFKVVKVLRSCPSEKMSAEAVLSENDGTMIETWCMVANWPPEMVD